MNGFAVAGEIIGSWALIQFVAIPVIRMEIKRREARAHVPQAEEVWLQGKDMLLYIDSVGPNGVTIIHLDGTNLTRWTDSWEEWRTRLKVKVVIFTGIKRPLGSA